MPSNKMAVGAENGARVPQRVLAKLPLKNNIQLLYVHTRQTVKDVLKVFVKKTDSQLTETNLL
jgi:hypothetical protein